MILEFQSIYAQSGRWNIVDIELEDVIEESFNPFMPKAGVGIGENGDYTVFRKQFQSIYAQSGRWNFRHGQRNKFSIIVSIHLCPKRALECF